jgi:hypothetical protein
VQLTLKQLRHNKAVRPAASTGMSFQMLMTGGAANTYGVFGGDNVSDACLRLRNEIELLQRGDMARYDSGIRAQMLAKSLKILAHAPQFVRKNEKQLLLRRCHYDVVPLAFNNVFAIAPSATE